VNLEEEAVFSGDAMAFDDLCRVLGDLGDLG
jgi:hypothetical protein